LLFLRLVELSFTLKLFTRHALSGMGKPSPKALYASNTLRVTFLSDF
jgi:hypothetical protein